MKTLKEIQPINLLVKYKLTERYSEYKEKFNLFVEKYNIQINEFNPELNLKIGDIVEFKNGFDVPMITEILGFNKETNKVYMLWDCYWNGIDLNEGNYKIKNYCQPSKYNIIKL